MSTEPEKQGKWFDLEAAEPLLEDGEGGYRDEGLTQNMLQNLVNPSGCRFIVLTMVKMTQAVIQFMALYLFVMMNIYVWHTDEDHCEEWLYNVAWYLVMFPWLIMCFCCGCSCCCIGGALAWNHRYGIAQPNDADIPYDPPGIPLADRVFMGPHGTDVV